MARTKAAKPAAEEARPAAVGKLFVLTSLRGKVESFGIESSSSSTAFRRQRREERQAWDRGVARLWFWPLRRRLSVGG